MAHFAYRARNAQGNMVAGNIEGSSKSGAAASLQEQGLTPIELKETSKPSGMVGGQGGNGFKKWLGNLRAEKVEHVDVLLFSRQIHTLLRAGVPIMRALAGMQESANKGMRQVLLELRESLDSGRDLSTSMARHVNKVFSPFYIAMVRVGEMTGMLEEIFLRMFHHLEFEKYMRDQVKSALRYPSFVMTAMAVAIAVVNIWVIPTFAKVFQGFKVELPLMTRMLIGFSNFMLHNWPFLLGGIFACIFAFKSWVGSTAGRRQWDQTKLNLPIAGKIIKKATLARFSRSFALAMQSGVPIIQAMTVVAQSMDNVYLTEKIEGMRAGIERGESVLRTAVASGMFPPVVLQMIAVGEESGSLDNMLAQVAEMYQNEVEYEIKTLGQQIEPIMIVFLGIMVLILALGIFLPIWDLGKAANHGR